METINGEILADWNTFVDQECAVGNTPKVVIVTDENVGDESSLTICGLVEATIYGKVEVEGHLFRRVQIHLTGGLKLDVVNTDDTERPNRFPCTLTCLQVSYGPAEMSGFCFLIFKFVFFNFLYRNIISVFHFSYVGRLVASRSLNVLTGWHWATFFLSFYIFM